MSRNSKRIAANDNGGKPRIRLEIAESPPLSIVEVEIFDALISNIEALVANDNDSPSNEEKVP
jgi:hypothetical protein